jgi:predicted MFS family arabinose efflux permease
MDSLMATLTLGSYARSFRSLNKSVRLCLLGSALLGLTVSGGSYGVLLNLYLLRLGYGTQFIGVVNAMSPLANLLFSLPASALGKRWGSVRAMTVGIVLSLLGNGLLPLLVPPPGLRETWILATYLIGGAGMALYLVNVSLFLIDATAPAERNHAFSLRVATLPFAGFAGSLVGGLLPGLYAVLLGDVPGSPVPYRYALLTSAVLLVPAIPTMIATGKASDQPLAGREEAPDARAGAVSRGVIPLGLMTILALVSFLRVIGEGTPRAFLNVYLDAGLGLSTGHIGVLIAAGRLLSVPASLLMPLFAARWGNGRTVAFGALGVALSLLPLALVPHWIGAGLGFLALTTCAAIARSAFIVYGMEAVAPRWRSTVSAMTTMSAAISWGATAAIGGYLIDIAGYRSTFLAGAVATAAGALLFWGRFCAKPGRHREPAGT